MVTKAISFSTFQEILRRRTLYFLFFLLFLFVFFLPNLPSFNVGVRLQLFLDFSLGSTSLFLAILAVALSANLLPGDIERKIVYQILSKPVKRKELIIGKYLGVILALLFSALVSATAIFLLTYLYFGSWQTQVFAGVFLGFLEASVLSAFVLLASTFATPTIAVFLTITFYFVGHTKDQLASLFGWFRLIGTLLPSLESYNLSEPIAHGVKIPISYLGLTLVDALLFSAFYLILAILIFNQLEL